MKMILFDLKYYKRSKLDGTLNDIRETNSQSNALD